MRGPRSTPVRGAKADEGRVTRRLRQLRDDRGLTMTELLIVILIIAVLATIALAVFLSTRSSAQDREAMAAVRTARVAMDVHQQNTGTYAATVADLVELDPSLSAARDLHVSGTATTFEVRVASAAGSRGGGTFTMERDAQGTITRTCANPGRGGCRPVADAAGNRW